MNPTKQDMIWQNIVKEAEQFVKEEPILASFLHITILRHNSFEEALGFHLSSKLSCPLIMDSRPMMELIQEALRDDPTITQSARADIKAVVERDPACPGYSIPLLFFKGYQAIQSYRIAHWLWNKGRKGLALYLQNRISEVFGVDIHPAAKIGKGILMDHATSVVIGETAVVDNDVSILHEVTLGGTGKERGDRHPKVHSGVLIGAGAKILGNIIIGEGAKIAAGSVVLNDVPPHCTVAGVPAKIVGAPCTPKPSLSMDHKLSEAEKSKNSIKK